LDDSLEPILKVWIHDQGFATSHLSRQALRDRATSPERQIHLILVAALVHVRGGCRPSGGSSDHAQNFGRPTDQDLANSLRRLRPISFGLSDDGVDVRAAGRIGYQVIITIERRSSGIDWLSQIAPIMTTVPKSRQAIEAQNRSLPGRVTGKLRIAIAEMVWKGARRAEAAAPKNKLGK
jgi:hypothetical protein